MRKQAIRLLGMAILTGAIVATTLATDACVWGGADFPNSNGCTTQSCGYLCGDPWGETSHWACKPATNSMGCCICSWTTWFCDCTLPGVGIGSVSSRHSTTYGDCPTYVHGRPQPIRCIDVATDPVGN